MVVIESIWLVFQNKIFSIEHREHDETIHVLPLLNNPFPVSKSCKDDSIRISLSTIELLINCCTFVIILGTGVTFVRRRSPLSADQPRQVSRWAARPRDTKVMIYNQSAELEAPVYRCFQSLPIVCPRWWGNYTGRLSRVTTAGNTILSRYWKSTKVENFIEVI